MGADGIVNPLIVTMPVPAVSNSKSAFDALAFDISWIVSGEYMNWATLAITTGTKVYNINADGTKTEITQNIGYPTILHYTGESALTGTTHANYSLVDLLNGVSPLTSPLTQSSNNDGTDQTTVTPYWTIRVEVEVWGTCSDNYGANFSDTTGIIYAIYTIYDAATGFNIDYQIEGPGPAS